MSQESQKQLCSGRYEFTDRPVSICGETVVYIGRDTSSNEAVSIREFFTETILARGENGEILLVAGREVQYKSLSSDYEELCQYVMGLSDQRGIACPIDVFWDNNTVYSVERLVSTETLDDHLARCGGQMSWGQLKKAIAPIFAAVSRLHSDGVYHRGISPETLLVDGAGDFLLSGFCIPAARTAGSEVASTLYFGYSAPEQYASSSWQGSWTDVYSLAAVCYRVLTGTTPVEWRQRGEGRELIPARAINSTVPETVSNALMSALSIDLRSRYRTVEEFWVGMLNGPGDATATYRLPIDRRENSAPPRRQTFETILAIIGVMLMVAVLSLNAIEFVINRYIGFPEEYLPISSEPEPMSTEPPAASEPAPIVVPNLVGISVENVMQDSHYTALFRFEVEWIYSESQPHGIVVATRPPFQTETDTVGSLIVLEVSKGSERIMMPSIVGLTLEQAMEELNKSEIRYETVDVTDYERREGSIVSTSKEVGSILFRTRDIVELRVARQYASEKQ